MSEWAFLVDENLEPQLARNLDKAGYTADWSPDVLERGAFDSELLAFAREHDRIVVPNDAKDYKGLPSDAHEGVLVVFDNRLSAFETTRGILRIIDAYPSRLRGYEAVDDWL